MKMLRRKSADMGDKVMQFVAFSNMNMERIERNSPKAVAATQNVISGGGSGRISPSGEPAFDAPSLANAIGNQPKPGSFAAMMKAKQGGGAAASGAAVMGGSGGGIFKKYSF